MGKALVLIPIVLGLVGCNGDYEAPKEGDNPAAVGGQVVTPSMRQKGGLPPNTLPPGEGRTGGSGSAAGNGAAGR